MIPFSPSLPLSVAAASGTALLLAWMAAAPAAMQAAPPPRAPATTPLHWPDKQGPTLDGLIPEAESAPPPMQWDEAAGRGIAWKTPLEDEGHSTPVIGGDMIWFTAATKDGTRMYLYGIHRGDGRILHHKLLFENAAPEPLGNVVNNYAAPSCVLEGDAVYAHFGSYGTARVDTASGEVVWSRRDIRCRHNVGPGSSPVLFENLLILTFDGIGTDQFIMALDKATGRDVWRTRRSVPDYKDLEADGTLTRDGDMRKAFSTPVFMPVAGGGVQMLSCASNGAFSYDPRTGREIWKILHTERNAAIRPIAADGRAYLNTGVRLVALKVDAGTQGDVTDHALWIRGKHNATFSSAVLIGGHLYQANAACVGICVDVRDGSETWSERLFTRPGKMFASAIATRKHVYFFSETGEAVVVAADPRKFTVAARNQLSSGMTASPAVAEGALYLRTKAALYKITEGAK